MIFTSGDNSINVKEIRQETNQDVGLLLYAPNTPGPKHPRDLASPNASIPLIPDNSKPCLGAFVHYGGHSMFAHYPWQLHDTNKLPYEFSFIDPKG